MRDPLEILKETETKHAAVDKKRADLKGQIEKFGTRAVPSKLRQEATDAELEAKSLLEILETKRRDVQLINDRYEEDRRRFVELQRQRAAMFNPNATTATPSGNGASKR